MHHLVTTEGGSQGMGTSDDADRLLIRNSQEGEAEGKKRRWTNLRVSL